MFRRKLGLALITATILVGCSAPAPKTQRVVHDSLLDKQGGVMLVADVCIQIDALGDSEDYFVLNESKTASRALLKVARRFMMENGIEIKAEIIPFVCGAKHDSSNTMKKVADHVNGAVSDQLQPFDVDDQIKHDPDYVKALSDVSSYAYEAALLPNQKTKDRNNSQMLQQVAVRADEFHKAIALIGTRTHASSLLLLGVAGTSISSGKATMLFVGSTLVGAGVAIATAGLGTGFYIIFIPGHQIDGRLMVGCLIDLETGQIKWSNAVRAGGDPIKPEVVSNAEPLNMLLRDLLYPFSDTSH